MRVLDQSFSVDFQYSVHFTTGLFNKSNSLFSDFLNKHRNKAIEHKVLFILDKGVVEHHPHLSNSIRRYFENKEGFLLVDDLLVINGGEEAKNSSDPVDRILDAINKYGIDRHSYICIVGGGAVLDMACFAASIGHRGIRHIRIPTTVLSQNDSGVGVKNGINLGGKKNFIGTFVPPFAVFNDSEFLKTLDNKNWMSGVSEAIKVGLIKDYAFFEWIEKHADALVERSQPEMGELIFRCAEIHLQHIRSGDPFESGSSRPLDFGHWSAHKLEQLNDFDLLHGEAVAIGIALDAVYSHKIGNLTLDEAKRVVDLFIRLKLPIDNTHMRASTTANPLLLGLDEFREHLGGRLCITLLEKLGVGKEYHEIHTDKLMESISFLKNYKTTEVTCK